MSAGFRDGEKTNIIHDRDSSPCRPTECTRIGRYIMKRARNMVNGFRRPFDHQIRHVPEFRVELDDPHRLYGPGDVVSGKVELVATRPIDMTHLVICLHGFAQAYKTPNQPGEGYREYNAARIAGRTDRAGGYYGNGFISLFEDELVLCGEGRLPASRFQFGFELEFPRKSHPSSIDFERGTISYWITATITRPNRTTIMNPVMKHEVPINYQEVVDISNIAPHRERMIKLLPQSRSMRKRRSSQLKIKPPEPESSSLQNSEIPDSPIESVHSTPSDNTPSVATRNSGKGKGPKLPFSNYLNAPRSQAIGCTVSLSKGGFLRGDLIEVRVQIEHNKVVKSLHGVIVTFYRLGRIDTNPPLEIASGDNHSKSRLRGPSWLPSTTGCHLFRRDLNQNFASILIDKVTLKQDIKASLRVPIDCFPTIASVPGAMISFKYYVEVIVDLPGKLTSLDKFLPSPGHSSAQGLYGAANPGAHAGTDWSSHCIDTEEIKREKDVHVTSFEVIVGTIDNSRERRSEPPRSEHSQPTAENGENGSESGAGSEDAANSLQRLRSDSMAGLDSEPNPPLPTLDESQLSEKERMRLAEQRLLPSAPELARASTPSAPFEADLIPVPAYQNGVVHSNGSPDLNHIHTSAPAYEPRQLDENIEPASTVKQEEERRLQIETASAPNIGGTIVNVLPSAPPMDDLLETSESQDDAELPGPSRRRHIEGVHDAEDVHDLPRYEQ